jgi:AcrR family transcriptional regulator
MQKHMNDIGAQRSKKRPRRESNRAGASTRERLLKTAVEMFAQYGFAETSLREITETADANIAAINYHFGSKEGLYEAVLDRIFRPVLEERLARLERLETEAMENGGEWDVDALLRSWIEPMLDRYFAGGAEGAQILDLEAQISGALQEGRMTEWPRPYIEYTRRFRLTMTRAVRHLRAEDVAWRVEVLCASALPLLTGGAALEDNTGGLCSAADRERFLSGWMSVARALLLPPS